MTGMPRAFWVLGGVGAFVAWLLWATGGLMYLWAVSHVFFAANKMERGIREVEALGRANPAFAPHLVVESARMDGQHKPGYVALSYGEDLHQIRGVSVNTQVRLTDLLEPGKTLPEPALRDAFAQARAAKLADAECRLLEQALARRCVVRHSNGSADDDGTARISMALGFVQKAPFGALPPGPRAAYVETHEAIGGTRPQTIAASGAADARARAYAQVADLCDRLRASEGNCAITHVMVSTPLRDPNGASAELSARATLSSLTAL